jgi:NDP-sugar pyrophosphorylase family protein
VGTIPSYLEAHWDVLGGRIALPRLAPQLVSEDALPASVRLSPPVSMAAGVSVGSGAELEGPLVIGPHAQIDAEAHLTHAVLWDDVRIGHGATLDNVVLTDHARVAPGSRVHGGVVMARVPAS